MGMIYISFLRYWIKINFYIILSHYFMHLRKYFKFSNFTNVCSTLSKKKRSHIQSYTSTRNCHVSVGTYLPDSAMIITPAVGLGIRPVSWLHVGQTSEKTFVVCEKTGLPNEADHRLDHRGPQGPGLSGLIHGPATGNQCPQSQNPENARHGVS